MSKKTQGTYKSSRNNCTTTYSILKTKNKIRNHCNKPYNAEYFPYLQNKIRIEDVWVSNFIVANFKCFTHYYKDNNISRKRWENYRPPLGKETRFIAKNNDTGTGTGKESNAQNITTFNNKNFKPALQYRREKSRKCTVPKSKLNYN